MTARESRSTIRSGSRSRHPKRQVLQCRSQRLSALLAPPRRQILAVEMANRESRSAWKDFLVSLKARDLKGVELVVSDDHAGLVAAIGEVIPEAA